MFIRKTLALLCVSPLLVLGCGGDLPIEQETEGIHLIIDAGSSGSRFCLYKVPYEADTCGSPVEPELPSGLQCKEYDARQYGVTAPEATGGLQGFKGNEELAKAMIAEGLNAILQEGISLRAAAALGTGGFRNDRGEVETESYALLWEKVSEALREAGVPSTALIASGIPGAMEGRLSWLTAQFLLNGASPAGHNMLETGGASVQVATGTSYADVQAESDTNGSDKTWRTYAADDVRQMSIPTLKRPEFKVCYSGNLDSAGEQDAAACIALLRAEVFDDNKRIVKLAAMNAASMSARAYYSMGNSWRFAVFGRLGTGVKQTTYGELVAKAPDLCSKPMSALPASDSRRHQGCFALSFNIAFLDALIDHGAMTAATPILNAEGKSTTVGAAASPEVFGNLCH